MKTMPKRIVSALLLVSLSLALCLPARGAEPELELEEELLWEGVLFANSFSMAAMSSMLYHSTEFRSLVLKPPALYQLLVAK